MSGWHWCLILAAFIAPTLQAFDGSLDPTFGPGGLQPLAYPLAASDDDDAGLALLSDSLGRRIVLITRRNPFPVAASRPLELIMFRYLASGMPDASFNLGSAYRRLQTDWTEFRGALIDRQNRVVVVGTIVDGAPAVVAQCLLRLLPDGSRDETFTGGVGNSGISCFSFGSSSDSRAVAVALMPNDDLVYAGNHADGNGNLILRRISGVDGTAIESWGNGGGFQIIDLQPTANAARDTVVGLAALPDNRVVVLAQSCSAALGCRPAAAQLLASDGQLDASFCSSAACIAGSVTGANHGKRVLRDPQLSGYTISAVTTTLGLREDSGRLLLAGRAAVTAGQAPLLMLRLNANGDLDTGFGDVATPGYQGLSLADAPLTPSALILDGASRYVLGGSSERIGLRRVFLARLTANGAPDASFAATGALAEYFSTPASADRALRTLATDGSKLLGLGDFNGASNRDAFWFRTDSDVLYADGFEG